MSYNAFAQIYRPGAGMAARLGRYGSEAFGEGAYQRPAAVIMQYTGLGVVTGAESPTYSCVGTSDCIANYRAMERRIAAIQSNGTDTVSFREAHMN